MSFIVSGPNVVPGIYFLIGIKPPQKFTPQTPFAEYMPSWNPQTVEGVNKVAEH
jgi:hypothetical protein